VTDINLLQADRDGIVPVPMLVKGELVLPPQVSVEQLQAAQAAQPTAGGLLQRLRLPGAQALRMPVLDRGTLQPTGESRYLVLAACDPHTLIEEAPAELARTLYALPFREVMGYVRALREALLAPDGALQAAAECFKAASPLADRAWDLLFQVLPALFDEQAMAEAVDRELGDGAGPGRGYLDGWVAVPAQAHRGMTARMADRLFARASGEAAAPFVRAVPTRQLHITAGNSPLVPLVSLLRALSSKGAAVIKCSHEAVPVMALLGLAMRAVDPHHPITRHMSLVHFTGGDREIEDVLLRPGAFDRLVVWGTEETVRSVVGRAGTTKTVLLNPRYGVSLIGEQAFAAGVEEAAVRAACDVMIANQRACIASLVHYVEGSEEEVLRYCEALRGALSRWDQHLVHRIPPALLGQLRRLRRGALLRGRWFENARDGETSSAVIYAPTPFDLSAHPMCRCVIVRRASPLAEAVRHLGSGVVAVGVYPEEARLALRDSIAATGVTSVLPLGECERAYAGMPHDGMRVLSELVSWTMA
jgi:hypothetical protein